MSEGFSGMVTMKVPPDQIARFKAMALSVAEQMSKEKGFERVLIHTLANDPTTFFIYESWFCSLDHFTTEIRNRSYRLEFNAWIDGMSAEDRQASMLDHVASYPS